jgi:hypothetical protein
VCHDGSILKKIVVDGVDFCLDSGLGGKILNAGLMNQPSSRNVDVLGERSLQERTFGVRMFGMHDQHARREIQTHDEFSYGIFRQHG